MIQPEGIPEQQASGVAERIVRSAERMFRSYGYAKTTVADVAQDAGISTAYVYRFYRSKLALCKAVCASLMGRLADMLWMEARSTLPAPDRLRRLYTRLCEETTRLLFEEEKLLDMVRVGLDQHWDAVTRFKQTLADISRAVIEDGIAEGRFRAPANMDEAVIAVGSTLMLCAHPVLLQEGLREDNPGRARALADLVVRSLMRP